MPRWNCRIALLSLVTLLAIGLPTRGRAASAGETPLVHPIFAHLPDAPEDGNARQAFTAATERYQLRPLEVVDVAAPPAPRAPDATHLGILHAQQLAFADALRELDLAANEVATTGGAGLTSAELGIFTCSVPWPPPTPTGTRRSPRRPAPSGPAPTPTICAPRP